MKKTLVVATRSGALAIAQTHIVVSLIQKHYPDIDIRIKEITTEGDMDRRTALWQLKETGFFTSRIEEALLAKKADIAVHSFKDLPTAQQEGLIIGAVLDRCYPQDCIVSAEPIKSLDELHGKAKIGTSSLRRIVQIKRLRPDLECIPIRGNVTTRLSKLEQGDFDAIILARAGLERLDLSDKISIVLDPSQFLPAPAQGALAVQARCDDAEAIELLAKLDDEKSRIPSLAERKILEVLQCGCHAPAGAFAKTTGEKITISAFFCEPDGQNYAQSAITGPLGEAERLAEQLANDLLSHLR